MTWQKYDTSRLFGGQTNSEDWHTQAVACLWYHTYHMTTFVHRKTPYSLLSGPDHASRRTDFAKPQRDQNRYKFLTDNSSCSGTTIYAPTNFQFCSEASKCESKCPRSAWGGARVVLVIVQQKAAIMSCSVLAADEKPVKNKSKIRLFGKPDHVVRLWVDTDFPNHCRLKFFVFGNFVPVWCTNFAHRFFPQFCFLLLLAAIPAYHNSSTAAQSTSKSWPHCPFQVLAPTFSAHVMHHYWHLVSVWRPQRVEKHIILVFEFPQFWQLSFSLAILQPLPFHYPPLHSDYLT